MRHLLFRIWSGGPISNHLRSKAQTRFRLRLRDSDSLRTPQTSRAQIILRRSKGPSTQSMKMICVRMKTRRKDWDFVLSNKTPMCLFLENRSTIMRKSLLRYLRSRASMWTYTTMEMSSMQSRSYTPRTL